MLGEVVDDLVDELDLARRQRRAGQEAAERPLGRLAAVPADYPLDFTASEFDPVKMTALFDQGYLSTQQNRVWNVDPPERAVSEERVRRGTVMTAKPSQEVGPFDPRVARPPGGSGPAVAARLAPRLSRPAASS